MGGPETDAVERASTRHWGTLAPLLLGVLGGSLGTSMLNTALPRLAAELSVPSGDRAWIVGAFPLAMAVSIVVAARIADRWGRRKLFLLGLAVVAVGNLIAAAASNGTQLVVLRVVLGVASALVLASVVATVGSMYSGKDLVIANGVWITTVGMGNAAGPVIGGVITEALGWRWVFLLLAPLALLAAGLACWLLPESTPRRDVSWDPASVLLSVVAVGTLVYGIQELITAPAVAAGLLALGAVAATLFVRRQIGLSSPLLDVTLFRQPGFARSSVQILMSSATAASATYLVSLHLQDVLHRSPLEAGYAVAPQAVATAFGGILAPLAVRHLSSGRALLCTLLAQGVGLLLLAAFDTSVFAPLALVGVGFGAVGTLATTRLFEVAGTSNAAQAGAVQEVVFAFGAGAGIATFSAIASLDARHGFAIAMAVAGIAITATAATKAPEIQTTTPTL